MTKSTISTFQLFERFPDAESARVYLEGRLWPNGTICPTCKTGERITKRKGGYYRCNACNLDFTVRTGTVLDRSHVPLHKWLAAMTLISENPDITSLALASELELTHKSASLTAKRIIEAAQPLLEKYLEMDKSPPVPPELDRIADAVLSYRPKHKEKPPRKRKSRAKKKSRGKVQKREPSI